MTTNDRAVQPSGLVLGSPMCPPATQSIVSALGRREGQMLLVEEMELGEAPAGATSVADRT